MLDQKIKVKETSQKTEQKQRKIRKDKYLENQPEDSIIKNSRKNRSKEEKFIKITEVNFLALKVKNIHTERVYQVPRKKMEEKREDKQRPRAESLKNYRIPGAKIQSSEECRWWWTKPHTKVQEEWHVFLITTPVTIILYELVATKGN